MKKLSELISKYWIILTVINFVLITVLSLSPLEKLPPVPGSDKTHHFIAYAALVFPSALKRPQHWITLAVMFVIYSGIIELLQPYVNRYGDWMDMAANTSGIVIGILLAASVRHFFRLFSNNF